jgi:opacity protein-like surface antigen
LSWKRHHIVLRQLLLGLALSLAFDDGPASAQSIFVGAGVGSTNADGSPSASVPYNGNALWLNGDVQLRFRRFALQVGAGHWRKTTPDSSFGEPVTLFQEEYDFHGDLVVLFPPSSAEGRFTPYVSLGAGWHSAKNSFDGMLQLPGGGTTTLNHDQDGFDKGFSVNGGAGLEFRLHPRWQAFVALRLDAASIGGDAPLALKEAKVYVGLRFKVN